MARIFISYRRADSKSITLALRLRLTQEADFDVFHDITNIPDGYDFRTYLRDGVAQCDVFLVVIGDKWISVTDEAGARRLDNPEDFVRIEVQAGLNRYPDCLVLPVLVNNATPPLDSQLPADLKPLAVLNMRRKVREDDDFETDMQKIIAAIRRFDPARPPEVFKNTAASAPTFKANQAVQDYYDAIDEQDWTLAEALIGQIERYKMSNPDKLKAFNFHDARQAIAEGKSHQACAEEYEILKITARRNPNRLQKALDDFWRVYPNYDPDNLYTKIPKREPAETPKPPAAVPIPAQKPASPLESALDRARKFTGAKNKDWQPFIRKLGEIEPNTPLPDMEMCLVPVGKFKMGGDGQYDGKPIHEQTIQQPYWIARYPVTNAQWRIAVAASAVKEPSDTTWFKEKSMADCPVVYVDWFESLKFAQWVKCNLPTEPLWEFAARGVESWVYPWGHDWEDGKRVVWEKNSSGKPNPVSSKPEGASWVGAMHLSGNVWEWQLSANQDYPYVANDGREGDLSNSDITRGLRGGSFFVNTVSSRAASRDDGFPSDRYFGWGFRVSRFNFGF